MGTSGDLQSQAEAVSALMDGEVTAGECEHTIRAISVTPDLRGRWTRYHLIRDVLHQTLPPLKVSDLPERVAAILASEPQYRHPRHRFRYFSRPRRARWRKAGTAAAAGAAGAVAVFLAVLVFAPRDSSTFVPQAMTSPPSVAWIPEQEVILTTIEGDERENAPPHPLLLDSYLMNHSEYLAGSGMGNVVPFIHVVSYGE
jgi:sigma-E factor negative regulatory protein RseA